MKYKNIIENFFSLFSLQIFNYILPLITFPYLVRILGPDKFGLISFAQAFATYFILITDYGFNFSAVRDIAINRENKEKVSIIVFSVYSVKFILFFLSFIIYLIVVYNISKFYKDINIYLFSFLTVLGNVLLPVWFFQGIEKMKYITISNILIKFLFVILIFLLIKKENDYIYVPLIYSLCNILVGLIGIFFILCKFKISIILPNLNEIINQIKNGWNIFLSTIGISFYTNSNTFILGLFTDNIIVGYYSAAEKIVRAIQALVYPIAQALYPYLSKLAIDNRKNALIFLKKVGTIIIFSTFFISFFLFIFSKEIIILLLGKKYISSIIVIKILAFLPFIVSVATVFANLFLLSFGYSKQWSNIILSASILSIFGAIVFVFFLKLNMIGIAINVLITEMIILLLSYFFFRELKNANR
ncbi:MAG: flippase [Candidatus Goldbacteria bacterium]|nr:flippase [Candidatus Goldiibacteriota bacterium]